MFLKDKQKKAAEHWACSSAQKVSAKVKEFHRCFAIGYFFNGHFLKNAETTGSIDRNKKRSLCKKKGIKTNRTRSIWL